MVSIFLCLYFCFLLFYCCVDNFFFMKRNEKEKNNKKSFEQFLTIARTEPKTYWQEVIMLFLFSSYSLLCRHLDLDQCWTKRKRTDAQYLRWKNYTQRDSTLFEGEYLENGLSRFQGFANGLTGWISVCSPSFITKV